MAVSGKTQVMLAPLLEDDAEFLFAYRSMPDVWRYQTWVPTSMVEAFAFVRNFGGVEMPRKSGWSQFAVRMSGDGRMVGDCGCHILDPETAEIGYTIAPAFQGRGLATRVVNQLITMLRESGIQKIIARTDERNTASIRVLEKADFRQDKHETGMYELRGEQVRDICYVWMEPRENGTR